MIDFNELDEINCRIRRFFAQSPEDADEMDAQYDDAKAAVERLAAIAEAEYVRRQEARGGQ